MCKGGLHVRAPGLSRAFGSLVLPVYMLSLGSADQDERLVEMRAHVLP